MSVTVRSVNHRFLDVAVHLPRRLSPLEGEAKEQVASAVARGRVEVSVQFAAESNRTRRTLVVRRASLQR